MPGWQRVHEQLSDKGLTVIAVAFDSRGEEAARPWIEAANPGYPALIDRDHVVADRYGMVNVPMAAWIDEDGYLVRPVEPAGTTDSFRSMDRKTGAMPEEEQQELRSLRRRYMDAIADWVEKGPASRYVFDRDALRERLRPRGETDEQARALFQLGKHLAGQGDIDAARRVFDRALELAPDNWSIRRQALNLEHPEKSGGPEFWAAVDALGDRRYYPRLELD